MNYTFSLEQDGRRRVTITRTYRHDALTDRDDICTRNPGAEYGPILTVGHSHQCVVMLPADTSS